MRTITISTPTFAAIWACREAGEQSEDQILRRLLAVVEETHPQQREPIKPTKHAAGGYYAKRYDVHFEEGFKIHRTYKGKYYEAIATNGLWKLVETGETFSALSNLSYGIGTKIENVWKNWLYIDEDGTERHISDLRHPSTISTRRS